MGNKPGQESEGRPVTRPRPATVASFSPPTSTPVVTESDFLRVKKSSDSEVPKKEDFLSVKSEPPKEPPKEPETARKRSDEISSALALGFAQVDTNRDGFIQPAKVLHIYKEVCTVCEAVYAPPKFRANDKVRFLQWDTLFKNIPTSDKRLDKALKQIDFSSYKDFNKNGKITPSTSPPVYVDHSTSLGTFVPPSRKRASMINLPTKATTSRPLPSAVAVPSPIAPTSQPTSPASPVSFVAFDSSSSAGSTGTATSSTVPPSPVSPIEDASPVYIRKSSTGGPIPFSTTTVTITSPPVTTSAPVTATSPSTTSPLITASIPGISPPITTKPQHLLPKASRKQSESKSKRTARQKSRKPSRPRSSTGDSDISVGSMGGDSELDLEFDVNLNIDKVDADLTSKRDGLKSDDEDDEDHSSIIARANAAWSAK